jgi:hypothetical protein
VLGEGLAFGCDGKGAGTSQVGNNGFPVTMGAVQGGALRDSESELLRSAMAQWVHAANRASCRTSAGLRMVEMALVVHAMAG